MAANVYLRCTETEDKVVGLGLSTSSGKQKEMFGCAYPHGEICGQLLSRRLSCKDGYEIVGLHSVFCVSPGPYSNCMLNTLCMYADFGNVSNQGPLYS